MNKMEFIQNMWKQTCERIPKRTINCRILWWRTDSYCTRWGMDGWVGFFSNPSQFYNIQEKNGCWYSSYLNNASNCTHWMWLPTPEQSFQQSKISSIKKFWVSANTRLPVKKKRGAYILWDADNRTLCYSLASTVDNAILYISKHCLSDNRNIKLTHWMPLVQPK